MTLPPFHRLARGALLCGGALLLLLATACSARTPTPTPTRTPRALIGPVQPSVTPLGPPAPVLCPNAKPPTFIKQVVLAKHTSEATEPVQVTEVFTPAQDKFHAVVSFENAPTATRLQARWYLIEAQGEVTNAQLDETENEVNGTGSIDFTLTPVDRAWLAGSYCVAIYANGQAALSKRFRVQDTTSSQDTPVVDVTFAQSVAPYTFEPVNPTSVLPPTAPIIHCIVQIQKAAANTKFRVRWLMPHDKPQEFTLTTQGTRRLDFTLKPPSDRGFDPGEYQVELYVNDKLERTEQFTVE